MKINKKFRRGFALVLGLLIFVPFNNCSNGFHSLPSTTSESSLRATSTPVAPALPVSPATPIPVIPPVVAPVVAPVSSGKVQVFMAAGKIARTIMSCDDGVTWINDRSDDDNARCWITGDPNYVECDHDARSFTGLDVGSDGWFYSQFGWGFNGTVRRSRNGILWETIRSGGWGGGLAVAFNHVVSEFENNMQLSIDQGVTFKAPTNWITNYDHAFLYRAGSKLINKGRGVGQVAISLDGGDTWKSAANFESSWGGVGFAEGNGILVSLGNLKTVGLPDNGYAARSLDNGITWTAVKVVADNYWTMPIQFNGTDFMAWSPGYAWKSKDGVTWTQIPITIDGQVSPYWAGSVSRNPLTGTYVSITGNWGSWYAKQTAIRSSDGIRWTTLDTAHFKGGHPIGKIVIGEIDASACGK